MTLLRLPRDLDTFHQDFVAAAPFPHLVVDDILDPSASGVDGAFPEADWPHWARLGGGHERGKSACADITVIPDPLKGLLREMNEPSFLSFLEAVTGVPSLMPDPYLDGGGLHLSVSGGTLTPHTDFHEYARLAVHRRLNALIYLNHEWTPADGGCLELFEYGEREPARSIVPIFGRCVVFATDARSVHGFSQPVADGRARRSVATYYYTARPSQSFGGDSTTHWHDDRSAGLATSARMMATRLLRLSSRKLLAASLRIDPNK